MLDEKSLDAVMLVPNKFKQSVAFPNEIQLWVKS